VPHVHFLLAEEIAVHQRQQVFGHRLLTVKIRQPSHEFTFGVGITFVSYPFGTNPRGITNSLVHVGFGV
jgi:hypothetical protein